VPVRIVAANRGLIESTSIALRGTGTDVSVTFAVMEIDIDEATSCVSGTEVDGSHITLTGPDHVAASAFDVDGILTDSAAYSIAAADHFGATRTAALPRRELDLAHLLTFCTTHVEVDGQPVPAWADLSGVYPTRNGRHIQIHCNFAHHADGVVARLGCAPDRESVAAAIAEREAFELEAELIEDGMIGAAIRTLSEWDAHPHAAATRDLPLISVEQLSAAGPVVDSASDGDALPLGGLRVLDCSRVLAGPVAGQVLASLGADVIRLGADHLPSVPVGVMSTGFGKRNASLDLRTERGAEQMAMLLADTDVWIDAYRPGALENLSFSAELAANRRPGIVVVQVSAFDWTGPWGGRRGFDSIVQSTTGIRWAGGAAATDDVGGPIGLPVQALDYATGFLAAGVAAHLVAHQRRVGGSWLARLSLLRTRNWLVRRQGPEAFQPAPVAVDARFLHGVDSDFGRLTSVRPLAGRVGTAPRRLGTSPPTWTT